MYLTIIYDHRSIFTLYNHAQKKVQIQIAIEYNSQNLPPHA